MFTDYTAIQICIAEFPAIKNAKTLSIFLF